MGKCPYAPTVVSVELNLKKLDEILKLQYLEFGEDGKSKDCLDYLNK